MASGESGVNPMNPYGETGFPGEATPPVKAECNDARSADDPINHPSHYQAGTPEVIDVIEGWNLGYRLGNVVKYILRSEHKDGALADLKKAKWYLDREIMKREEKTGQ